jgi:hypothetical protein
LVEPLSGGPLAASIDLGDDSEDMLHEYDTDDMPVRRLAPVPILTV